MTIPFISIFVFTFISLITDLKSRIVPNWLIGVGLLTGSVYQLFFGSIWQGLGGLLLAFAIGFPLFLLGGLGAGDVKLLMVIGLWTNAVFFLNTLLWIAIFGAVLTILVMILHRTRGKNVYRNIQYFFFHLRAFGKPPQKLALESITLPYCVPIFLGTVYSIALQLW